MVNEIESARWAEVVSPPNDVDAQLGELEVPATVLARRHGMTMAVLSQNSALGITQHRWITPAADAGLPRQQHADLLEELLGQARLDDVGIAASRDGALSAPTNDVPGTGDDGDVSRAALPLQPPDRLPSIE